MKYALSQYLRHFSLSYCSRCGWHKSISQYTTMLAWIHWQRDTVKLYKQTRFDGKQIRQPKYRHNSVTWRPDSIRYISHHSLPIYWQVSIINTRDCLWTTGNVLRPMFSPYRHSLDGIGQRSVIILSLAIFLSIRYSRQWSRVQGHQHWGNGTRAPRHFVRLSIIYSLRRGPMLSATVPKQHHQNSCHTCPLVTPLHAEEYIFC